MGKPKCPATDRGQIRCGIAIQRNIIQQLKEWSTDLYYNIDKPWKHYTKGKMLLTKDCILYNFIYNMSRIVHYLEREKISCQAGLQGRRGMKNNCYHV